MQLEEVTIPLEVRPADLDSLGHVNNARVLEYLEAGRWAWMAHHGVRRTGRVVPVVSRIEIDYRKEIPFQKIFVISAPVSVPPDFEDLIIYRVTFHQRVLLEQEGPPAADARVEIAFVDAEKRTLMSLQEFLEGADP